MTVRLTKHTLLLRAGDFDFLRERFPKLGGGPAIRRIVSKMVDHLDRPITEEELKELESINDE